MPADASAPRVLHLRSSCGFYGAESVIYNLVRAYTGESVAVCFEDRREPHTELTTRLLAVGHSAETIPASGAFDPGVLVRFAGAMRRIKPDIVHSHDYKSDSVAWAVARWMGAHIVSTLHGNLQTTTSLRRYEKVDAWLLRRFDRVAAVSEARRQEALAYGVDPGRLEVVINGVDTQRFRPMAERLPLRRSLGLPDDGLLVGVVGRLSAEKGHAMLISAAAALGGRSTEVRLAFIGDGPLEAELRRAAVSAGVPDRVHFPGRRDDMREVYNALDVLALPSFSEGLPMTIIEAAACGRPILATDVGAVGRVVRDGETGYLVPPGDEKALTNCLVRILDNRGEAERMGKAARELAEREFSAEAMARSYLAFYEKALCHSAGTEATP